MSKRKRIWSCPICFFPFQLTRAGIDWETWLLIDAHYAKRHPEAVAERSR